MPDRREVQRSKLKVGVLVIVALAAVATLAILISGKTGTLFTFKLEVRAYFKNSAGVKIGSPVNLDGVTIGNVRSVRIVRDPADTPVEVVMAINNQYRHDLLTDSRANLSTIGVLGATEVDIDNRHAHGHPVANHAVLQTGVNPNLEDAIRSFQTTNQKIGTALGEVNVLIAHLSSNEGSIGKLINDPALRNRAATAVSDLSSIPTRASEGQGTIGKFMTDDSLMNHLKDMQAKLTDISTAVNSGQGTAGKFMKDPTLSRNLKKASEQLQQISTEVRSGHGAVSMVLNDPDFKKKLHDADSQLDSIKAEVSAGQGTIGQMKKNPSLHNHLNELVAESRQLMTGIREHPMKYVSLHLRIF